MPAPILIFAVGNESRGDDALAPLLLRRLQEWVASERLGEQIELLEDFQLQVEHVADMSGRRLVLFVDAGMDTPEPYVFYRVEVSDSPVLFSHALKPEALLAVYRQVYRETPPPIFVLCIRGERFDLGDTLSLKAEIRLEAALGFMRSLLRETDIPSLEKRAGGR
ncbi:MAG: HoxW protein [Gallionellaceae bacterium]|nr:MAG: HoxW protein [Gallionellaceae bacterium]